jgi:hypothetical protein
MVHSRLTASTCIDTTESDLERIDWPARSSDAIKTDERNTVANHWRQATWVAEPRIRDTLEK